MASLLDVVGDQQHVGPRALNPQARPAKDRRALKQRAADILAYFDRPGTSNGPTEAINGRLEHLRGSALGFRNLTNYVARSLLETGGFRPRLHPRSGRVPLATQGSRATVDRPCLVAGVG